MPEVSTQGVLQLRGSCDSTTCRLPILQVGKASPHLLVSGCAQSMKYHVPLCWPLQLKKGDVHAGRQQE